MHWLVFLCLVSSSGSRLLEIDGDEDSNVRMVEMREVQGDVGMMIGLQSVVKARIEKMEKDMGDMGKVKQGFLSLQTFFEKIFKLSLKKYFEVFELRIYCTAEGS